jgi:hypothetical protein
LEIIKIIAQDLKRLEEYETLAINEIEAWLSYFSAQEQNKELVKTLKEARKAIISSDAKMPAYWQDSVGQVDRMEIVDKIEEFIKKFSDQ